MTFLCWVSAKFSLICYCKSPWFCPILKHLFIILMAKIYIERDKENVRNIRDIFHLMGLSPKVCNSWGWTETLLGYPTWVAGTWVIESLSDVSWAGGASIESWIRIQGDIQNILQAYPLCHAQLSLSFKALTLYLG